jgi:hypothetical protein
MKTLKRKVTKLPPTLRNVVQLVEPLRGEIGDYLVLQDPPILIKQADAEEIFDVEELVSPKAASAKNIKRKGERDHDMKRIVAFLHNNEDALFSAGQIGNLLKIDSGSGGSVIHGILHTIIEHSEAKGFEKINTSPGRVVYRYTKPKETQEQVQQPLPENPKKGNSDNADVPVLSRLDAIEANRMAALKGLE